MLTDLLNRYLKILVLFVVAWAGFWGYDNVGCRKIAGAEMEPEIKRDTLKLLLTRKRFPPDVATKHLVYVRLRPIRGLTQDRFAGRVLAGPGEVVWVERKILSPRIKRTRGLAVRTAPPETGERDRFLPIIVPRDTYYVVCANQREYSLYDSRTVGPIGYWAVEGRVRE